MKFRTRSATISAIQWTGENAQEIRQFTSFGESAPSDCIVLYPGPINGSPRTFLQIHTLKRLMMADPGDWIIKGSDGKFYPCRSDVFASLFELAEQESI